MPDLHSSLESFISDEMSRWRVPGVAVGILHNGQGYSAGFGVTNVLHPLPVDSDTLFQIGSTTKTVTATVAMRLVEAGKLELDAPIRGYLPELRLADESVAQRVTLRHCFTHTGGWLGDYFDDTGDGDDALARYVARMADLPQLTPLGEIWSYNNAGFGLAGRVIEAVTGQPYEQVARQLVLQPLGMEMSFFGAADAISHRCAVGHEIMDAEDAQKARAKVARPWALARNTNCVGGLISSVKDQLRYARFHLGDGTAESGERLLSPGSIALMQSELAAAGSGTKAVGVSWLLNEVAGVKTVAHGGATLGQMSAFLLAPTRNFAVTVLTNADRGRALHARVVKWALENIAGLVAPEPSLLSLSAAELTPYAGHYSAALSDLKVTVEGARLILQVIPKGGFPKKDSPPGPTPPPAPAAFTAPDRLLITDGPSAGNRGDILRGHAGEIVWLRIGSRVHKRSEA
ncbi:MAG: class A beta-lactamase-related serine hydrolase [Chloroflexi bacterium]|nr:MAG: class A beta-lactamase-related serine hydrolase [Chloroflexota bacterium]